MGVESMPHSHGDPDLQAITEVPDSERNTPRALQRTAETHPGSAEVLSTVNVTPVDTADPRLVPVGPLIRADDRAR